MKEINDNELDSLISETLRRENILEEVNKQVMLTVRKQKLRKLFVKWAIFSFGISALTVLPFAGIYYFTESGMGKEVAFSFAFSMLIFLISIIYYANKFSAKFYSKIV